MEPLSIEGSPKTPTVNFDPVTGKLEMKGRSIPENAIEFYKPLVVWLEEYYNCPQKLTEFFVHFEYFNTSSSKCLVDVFRRVEAIYKSGNNVIIHWYFEEDDGYMQEAGEDYQSIIKVPFKMVEVTED
ncbi:MAG: DUF1987 domain-containing protein [Bacteroidia bacterium]|nr:DUF1987 domain-containing protein [Bacteroidia bacterium]